MLATSAGLNGVYLLVTIFGTAITTALGIYATVISPRNKERERVSAEHDKERAEEARLQAERDQELDGIPAVPGVTEGVPRLVLRVLALERSNNEVVAGQKLLERRMDEANGTGKRTEKMVEQILADRVSVAAAHVGLLDADAAGKLPTQ